MNTDVKELLYNKTSVTEELVRSSQAGELGERAVCRAVVASESGRESASTDSRDKSVVMTSYSREVIVIYRPVHHGDYGQNGVYALPTVTEVSKQELVYVLVVTLDKMAVTLEQQENKDHVTYRHVLSGKTGNHGQDVVLIVDQANEPEHELASVENPVQMDALDLTV